MAYITPPTFTVGAVLPATSLTVLGNDILDLDSRTRPTQFLVSTTQTSTSGTYVDLATICFVTVTTGTAAMVAGSANMFNGGGSATDIWISFAITGATTTTAADQWGCRIGNVPPSVNGLRGTFIWLATGLTAGSNTFTMKYRNTNSQSCNWNDRQIIVWPGNNVT